MGVVTAADDIFLRRICNCYFNSNFTDFFSFKLSHLIKNGSKGEFLNIAKHFLKIFKYYFAIIAFFLEIEYQTH